MSAEWVKYCRDNNDFCEDIGRAKYGHIVKYEDGSVSHVFNIGDERAVTTSKRFTRYLICQPLPHAEMRARHAMTGEAVEYFNGFGYWQDTNPPAWAKDNKYRFKEPEKEKIYYRNYLAKNSTGEIVVYAARKSDSCNPLDYESSCDFIKWIHNDWQEVEI